MTTPASITQKLFLPSTLSGLRLQGKLSAFQGKRPLHALDVHVQPMPQSPRLQGKSPLLALAALAPPTTPPVPTWPPNQHHPPSPGLKHLPPSPTFPGTFSVHLSLTVPPPSPSLGSPSSTPPYCRSPGSPSAIPTTSFRPLSPATSMTATFHAPLILGSYLPNVPTLLLRPPVQIIGRIGPSTRS